MLNHVDSPYIRAIGFLFLRYATPPKGLLDWCWDYLNDDE
jgi:pre-mRNA-splicing factor 38B